MIFNFLDNAVNAVSSLPFNAVAGIVWGSYLAIYLLAVILNACVVKIKYAPKKPFLSFTNAYAALTLAMFLTYVDLTRSLIGTLIFWIIGYVLYGSLCAFTKTKVRPSPPPSATVITSLPAAKPTPPPVQNERVPAAKSNVRLDHAVSVTDKLLTKNLSKSDRQELEKLKNTLAVLQIKGTLSPAESDILNENFNALLKLMAKYDI